MQESTVHVNIVPGGMPIVLHISQYDVGLRQYVFTLYSTQGTWTDVSGASATLEATKPDNHAIVHNCTYNNDGTITYTVQEQLAAVVGRVWSKLVIRDTSENVVASAAIIWIVDPAGVTDSAIVSDSDISALQEFLAEFGTINAYKADLDSLRALAAGVNVAATKAAMTNHNIAYVYTGSESGMVTNNWYWYNGSAWVSGGAWEASITTDTTLTTSGKAADAKATGDAITELKADIGAVTGNAIIAMIDGYYMAVGDSTTSINSPTSNASYRYAKVSCSPGDVFTINATAAAGAKPFGFASSTGTTIERPYMASGNNLTVENYVVKAPANSAYLIVNDTSGKSSFYGDTVGLRADDTQKITDCVIHNTRIPVTGYKFYNGTLNTSGKYSNNTYRITTRNYIDLYDFDDLQYSVDSGYRIYIAFYSDPRESAYVSAISWQTGTGTLTKAGRYMRVILDTTGGSTTLSPSDASHFSITLGYSLKTLIDNKYEYIQTLGASADLNDIYENGWYTVSNAASLVNAPEIETGQRLVVVYANGNTPATNTFRHMFYANYSTGVYAHRVYASGYWTKWGISDGYKMRSESFTPSAQASQGANTGINCRVMTYNVARYNNDTSTYLSNNKLFNLRRMIGKANADFLCTQEDTQYIDSGGTKESDGYVYLPQYPYNYSESVYLNIIHSKKSATAHGRVKPTDGANAYRSFEYATYDMGNSKVLLVINTHINWADASGDGTSADNIARRLSQYTDLFSWANRDITLADYSSGSAVTAPTHTHCIICMDGNSATATDKTNLATVASGKNFILGNGGALGWFLTELHYNYSIDNIAVSNNIIINNIETYDEWYQMLYSDHIPVVADVTLL